MLDSSLINALKLGFSSTVQKIRIPSLGTKEFSFREPNVKEVSTISKLLVTNTDSPSTIYASTIVFLKFLCLDDDFNPYVMNEIDRIKIFTYVLSGIFYSKNLTIKCPRVGCGNTFPYSIKYGDILKSIDNISTDVIEYENKTDIGNIKIVYGFPKTKRYLEFLEFSDGLKHIPVDYSSFNNSFVEIDNEKHENTADHKLPTNDAFVEMIKKRRNIINSEINKITKMDKSLAGNVDIKNQLSKTLIPSELSYLYIKNITITGIPGSKDDFNIDFEGLTYDEIIQVMDVVPMKLMIDSKTGLSFTKIIELEIGKRLSSCAPDIICSKCNCDIGKRLGIQNFFIHG